MKFWTKTTLIGALALSLPLLSGCAGDGTNIKDNGTTDEPKWHPYEKVTFDKDKGTYPNLENLKMVRSGLTKDQLYYLLGRPQYEDGWRPRQWNYLFHFITPGEGRGGITTCQFKAVFDKDGFANGFYWHPVSPEDGSCPPSKQIKLEVPTDTLFRFGQSGGNDFLSGGKESILRFADQLKKVPGIKSIEISGYTDYLGSDAYNQSLSEKRAETIKELFVSKGIPADIITAIGKGESEQVKQCPGLKGTDLKDCLAPNRRVVITVK